MKNRGTRRSIIVSADPSGWQAYVYVILYVWGTHESQSLISDWLTYPTSRGQKLFWLCYLSLIPYEETTYLRISDSHVGHDSGVVVGDQYARGVESLRLVHQHVAAAVVYVVRYHEAWRNIKRWLLQHTNLKLQMDTGDGDMSFIQNTLHHVCSWIRELHERDAKIYDNNLCII